MRLQSILAGGVLLLLFTILAGSILWKLIVREAKESTDLRAELLEPSEGNQETPDEPFDEEEVEADPTPAASGNPTPEGPPLDRARSSRLVQECEKGGFSACDQLTSACVRLIPEAPQRRMRDIAGVSAWQKAMSSKAHTMGPIREGCVPYFHAMACRAGSNTHCLSAGTGRALSDGCQRGCKECCEARLATADPGSNPGLARDCDGGDASACLELATRLERTGGAGVAEARKRAQSACQLSPHACDDYALFVGLGRGGPRDEKEALRLLERARTSADSGAGCQAKGSPACVPLKGISYWEIFSTIAPEQAEAVCKNGDPRACLGRMLPSQDDQDRRLDDMDKAAAQLFPPCSSVLAHCPAAIERCQQGEVRACLAIVGRAHYAQRGDLDLAFGRLKRACSAGDPNACIE